MMATKTTVPLRVNDNGKGDFRRPRQVSDDDFARNWDAVFGKKSRSDVPHDEGNERADPPHEILEDRG